MFTNIQVRDKWVPVICLLAPFLGYLLTQIIHTFGYEFGYELLVLNGLITMLGLYSARTQLVEGVARNE